MSYLLILYYNKTTVNFFLFNHAHVFYLQAKLSFEEILKKK